MSKKRSRILSLMLSMVMSVLLLSGVGVQAVENPFTDVSSDTYYYDAVLWAVEKNVTAGTTPTTFSPDSTCTRAQTVTFLWRAMGEPKPTSDKNPFIDVKPTDYYYNAVLWAVEKDITMGTSATTFSPSDTVSRGQVVTFLWRAAGRPDPTTGENSFTDISPSEYYYGAVLWAVDKGVTNGTAPNTFAPASGCTRGQIVTFLHRYFTVATSDLKIILHPTSATVGRNTPLTSLSVTIAGGEAPYDYVLERWFDSTGEWMIVEEGIQQTAKTWTSQKTRLKADGDYRFRINVIDATGTKVTSNEAIITVAGDLKIVSHPTSATVGLNANLSSLTVSISGGKAPYHYQTERFYDSMGWKVVGEQWDVNETTWCNNLKASGFQAGTERYRINVIDATGTKVTSDEATITVVSDLKIILHPTSATVGKNTPLTSLSVTIAGGKTPYDYVLERWFDSTGEWMIVEEGIQQTAKTWTSQKTRLKADGDYRFRINVIDATGTKVTSNEAIITVAGDLKIVSHPTSATVGLNANLSSLTVSISGGKAPYHYQTERFYDSMGWKVVGEQWDVNETTWCNNLKASGFQTGTERYRINVIDATGIKVTSDEATITVQN